MKELIGFPQLNINLQKETVAYIKDYANSLNRPFEQLLEQAVVGLRTYKASALSDFQLQVQELEGM